MSGRRDLNPRPLDPQSSALPNCATSRCCPSGSGLLRPARAQRTLQHFRGCSLTPLGIGRPPSRRSASPGGGPSRRRRPPPSTVGHRGPCRPPHPCGQRQAVEVELAAGRLPAHCVGRLLPPRRNPFLPLLSTHCTRTTTWSSPAKAPRQPGRRRGARRNPDHICTDETLSTSSRSTRTSPCPRSVGARRSPSSRTRTTVSFSSERLLASTRRRSRRTTTSASSTAMLMVSNLPPRMRLALFGSTRFFQGGETP